MLSGTVSFVLDRGMPGLVQSKPLRKMGMHSSPTGELFLDDVRVGVAKTGVVATLKGGKNPTFVIGKPDSSMLLSRVFLDRTAGDVMPPKAEKPMTETSEQARKLIDEAERRNRRRDRAGDDKFEPLYTEADALAAWGQAHPVERHDWFEPAEGFRARLWNAGHILGSASVELEAGGARVVCSGDLGAQRLHVALLQMMAVGPGREGAVVAPLRAERDVDVDAEAHLRGDRAGRARRGADPPGRPARRASRRWPWG